MLIIHSKEISFIHSLSQWKHLLQYLHCSYAVRRSNVGHTSNESKEMITTDTIYWLVSKGLF